MIWVAMLRRSTASTSRTRGAWPWDVPGVRRSRYTRSGMLAQVSAALLAQGRGASAPVGNTNR